MMFTISLILQNFPQENEKEYSDLKQSQDVDGNIISNTKIFLLWD